MSTTARVPGRAAADGETNRVGNTSAGSEFDVPGLDLFDVLAQPDRLQDPYPFYTWLRANRPVHTDPDGTVYLSRHEDAVHLKDPDLRTASAGDDRSFALDTFNRSMIKSVAPRHGELRRVAGAAFDRRLLARAGERIRCTAERLAGGLAATLAAEGTADLHTEYSVPFTQQAAGAVFGIPDEDVERLAAMPGRIFAPLYPKSTPAAWAEADDTARDMWAYLEEAVRCRRFTPDSGFARLAEASGTVPDEEIIRLCWILWLGSYTSAMAALDLATLTLIDHPDTAALLHEDAAAWVSEALRYRSPHVINSANLTTRRELVIAGTTLPPGTPVRFLLASMNRDQAAFPNVDVYDPRRKGPARHIAFGQGVHSCIGTQMARMELATALTTLTTRLPRLGLAEQPAWRPYTTQRICTRLTVCAA